MKSPDGKINSVSADIIPESLTAKATTAAIRAPIIAIIAFL
jgi:hypothetical protein